MKKSYLKFLALTAYILSATLYAGVNKSKSSFDSLKKDSPFGDRKPVVQANAKPVETPKTPPKPPEPPKAKIALDCHGISHIGNMLYATFIDKSKTPNIAFTIPQNSDNVYGYIFKDYNKNDNSVEVEYQNNKYTLKVGIDHKNTANNNTNSNTYNNNYNNNWNNNYNNNYNWDDSVWDNFDWDWDDDLAFDGLTSDSWMEMGEPNWDF